MTDFLEPRSAVKNVLHAQGASFLAGQLPSNLPLCQLE